MSIEKIEGAAKTLRAARDLLTERATSLHDEMQAAIKRKLPGLRKAVADVVEAEAILKAAIAEAPGQFKKPRSIVLHGLQLGYRKGKGKIEWDDDEKVAKLIAKHFPEEYEVLCTTTIKPVKAALGNLSVAELKKIGVTVEATGDVVFVKDATAGVDKLVKALLKGAEDEAEAA